MEIASHGLTGERVDGIGVLLEVGMILATIQTTIHIVVVITKPRNCIWHNVEITARNVY